jgi:hypothetical protein
MVLSCYAIQTELLRTWSVKLRTWIQTFSEVRTLLCRPIPDWTSAEDVIYLKFVLILWHVCWKPELWSQQRQTLLRNGSADTSVVRQWLSSRHVMTATDKHATIEELLEAVFSVRPFPSPYNEDQLPLLRHGLFSCVEAGSNTSTCE